MARRGSRRRRPTKRFWGLLAILLLSPLVVLAWNQLTASEDDLREVAKQPVKVSDNRKINVLVLGINQRKHDPGRSNVTCLMTVDMAAKTATLLWVPRDSRVNIPGYEWNKIGHAYAYGGAELSKKTVSKLLDVPIDYYLAVNMDGFTKVIDALGGIDIDVEKRMYYYDPYDEGETVNEGLIDLKPGLQHMDGIAALQYVRFRNDEMGDIGRIERQQKFSKALLAHVTNPRIIPRLPSAIREVSAIFKTDMSYTEFVNIAKIVNDAYRQGLQTEMVSGRPVYIDDISYWLPDITAMRRQVAQIQGITVDGKYLTKMRQLADEYDRSVAKSDVVDAL